MVTNPFPFGCHGNQNTIFFMFCHFLLGIVFSVSHIIHLSGSLTLLADEVRSNKNPQEKWLLLAEDIGCYGNNKGKYYNFNITLKLNIFFHYKARILYSHLKLSIALALDGLYHLKGLHIDHRISWLLWQQEIPNLAHLHIVHKSP